MNEARAGKGGKPETCGRHSKHIEPFIFPRKKTNQTGLPAHLFKGGPRGEKKKTEIPSNQADFVGDEKDGSRKILNFSEQV
ncbi:MAG: hypothetical protein D6714_16195, partial [Bacteroidetes bacterium]